MGCSGCGHKRKNRKTYVLDAPVLDNKEDVVSDSYLSWSDSRKKTTKSLGRRSAQNNITGIMIEPNKIRNIISIPHNKNKLNILKHSKNEKAVYIIGHFKGCSVCRYMHRLIDKVTTPFMKMDISFYSISKDDVKPTGIQLDNNPIVVFIDKGKAIKQFSGIQPNISTHIKNFYMGINSEKNQSQGAKILGSQHTVYKLKPNPTHVDAYEKLLKDLKDQGKTIKNITTFLDNQKNILVVTIDFK